MQPQQLPSNEVGVASTPVHQADIRQLLLGGVKPAASEAYLGVQVVSDPVGESDRETERKRFTLTPVVKEEGEDIA